MTNHFNELSEAEQERLAILIEECTEAAQIDNKGKLIETNRQALQRELGDVMHALRRMQRAGDLDGDVIADHANSKPAHIEQYLHHQATKPETPHV